MNLLHKWKHNRCLMLSELVYGLFHAADRGADYRINIVLSIRTPEIGGHAWVTRNERNFLSHSVAMTDLRLLGDNGKYRYYVKENKN